MIFKNGNKLTPAIGSAGLLKIMMNDSQLWPEIQKEIPLSETTAGDILLWDKTGLRKLFVSSDSLSSYPSDSYTPIGIVVIPASHDVYGDGSCGVMSLRDMDYNTPEEGSNVHETMIYSWMEANGTDVFPVMVAGNTQDGIPQDGCITGYLPGDSFSGTQCLHDTDAYYSSDDEWPIPSPYLTDGSRNPGYCQEVISSENNALSSFKGKEYTDILIGSATGQSDWKTAQTITNSDDDGHYPAACCCWRYHTEGTQEGDWYLPSVAELGYTIPVLGKIDDVIQTLIEIYGQQFCISLSKSNIYCSCTQGPSGSDDIYDIYVGTGKAQRHMKTTYFSVKAFMRVSSMDMSGISPESASNGVYVYANNGKLYNPDDWNTANNDSAVGVAVVTDDCKFAITKGEKPQIAWSAALYGTDVSGLTNYDDKSQAVTDFNGENNTSIIIEAASTEDASNNAAHYCYNQTVSISGRGTVHGYLPALGELQAAYNNNLAIDSALSKIGGTAMPTDNYLWSSTECSSYNAWGLRWLSGTLLNFTKGYSSYYAVPVFPLISSNP